MWTRLVVVALALSFPLNRAYAQAKPLNLNQAIAAALENNAGVKLSEEREVQAQSRMEEQRAGLLPNVQSVLGHTNQTVNLGARGIRFPGIPIPTVVGPFSTTDARLQYGEPLFDLSLIRRYQSSRRQIESSRFDTETVKNNIAASVARLYYDVQRASAMIEAVRIQIELGENLLNLARQRREVGIGTGLDVTRAESRLASDRHRLLEVQNEHRTARLRLLRAMGERLDQPIELTDPLETATVMEDTVDQALAAALRNRPEWLAQESRLASAGLTYGSARAERLPTIQAFADYGNSGTTSLFVPTHTVGLQLALPLFDGGRRAAHRKNAASQLRQEEIRANDLRDEIELEVRVALDRLASAREQLSAAEQYLKLTSEELELARLRFEAQVSTHIDVVNAQAELATARSRRVNALYTLKVAEIEYARVLGRR